jgi:hypothetical protein
MVGGPTGFGAKGFEERYRDWCGQGLGPVLVPRDTQCVRHAGGDTRMTDRARVQTVVAPQTGVGRERKREEVEYDDPVTGRDDPQPGVEIEDAGPHPPGDR